MDRIQEMKELITALNAANADAISTLRAEAYRLFSERMAETENQATIQAMISLVENSRDLTQTDDEYFSQYARVDFGSLIDASDVFQQELLQEYLDMDFYVRADFENDCLITSIGPAIIINHDGDVLDQDSGKWILSKGDYETDEERDALIEAYMESSGYFPAVIQCDYYGNASYRNTQSKNQSA